MNATLLPTELPRRKDNPIILYTLSQHIQYKPQMQNTPCGAFCLLVAGAGNAPASRGYEPREVLFLHPAIEKHIVSQIVELLKYTAVKIYCRVGVAAG